MKRTLMVGLVVTVTVLLLGVLAPLYGQALASKRVAPPGAESLSAVSTTTQYYSIPGVAFTALAPEGWTNQIEIAPGGTFLWAGGTGPTLWAPVYLPQGATVTKFEVWVIDNSTHDMGVDLLRLADPPAGSSSLASVSSTGSSPDFAVLESSLSTTVDNSTGAYMVRVSAPSLAPNLGFRVVRITYTVPAASPTAVTLTDFDAISGATGWLQGAALLVAGVVAVGAAVRKSRKDQ